MSDASPPADRPTVLAVGALYTGSARGLRADLRSAEALGLHAEPICTALVMASHGRVTDVTDVPADTVAAQLEHVQHVRRIAGASIGILAGHKTVEVVMGAAKALGVPVVLNVVASGPSGETVLTARGIDALSERLGVPDLVTLNRADAELVTGGEIQSLDDAQVAAQRIAGRGARRVVIRCGTLPYRFYDPADDPGMPGGDGQPERLYFDLYYDGEDFALFEAPLLPGEAPSGAASLFCMAALEGLVAGRDPLEALQSAKRHATEGVRHTGEADVFAFDWKRGAAQK
ncbi:MAG: PfkB family carbohydrate kinase [Rubricoccaceae bacterium]